VAAITANLQTDGYTVMSGPRTTGDGYYEKKELNCRPNSEVVAFFFLYDFLSNIIKSRTILL